MEHVNRHAYAASKLAEEGFEVLAFDLRGHGKSEGIKG
jgi:alpha-beta hydrolase superfamily lysophospholipase